MKERSKGTRDSSGTAGGTDAEPLGGGMDEIDGSRTDQERRAGVEPRRPSTPGQENDRETDAKKDPPSPYHDLHVSEGGLAPQAMPGEGPTPSRPRGEIEATAGEKIAQERGEYENEAANAPRGDPSDRGVDS